MNELSLFTGAGGGLLASQLLNWRTIGAVEINEYCCKVLEARQRDGCLEKFPIWNLDIREFNERVADQYRGMVDVISAGFPCQPFSVAGKGQAENDDRNMWPATIECVCRIRPRYVFLENVPGLLAHEYSHTIFRQLAESGYDARWRMLSAAEVGAPHLRKRLWIVAADSEHGGFRQLFQQEQKPERSEPADIGGNGKAQPLANAAQELPHGRRLARDGGRQLTNGSKEISDTNHERLEERQGKDSGGKGAKSRECEPIGGQWWATEPNVGRVADGVASRVDRLKAIGNGQVPQVAAAAWSILVKT